ncbi:hypothetical protein ZHAS_00006397 [Anopheles sinensis]|uniref:Uncharacterized protein n=1 Tax=Anopheles sinensis TaxID=74873 RepID=A0A084VM79_ANOSI|nr:hypothetical protein ZHAS_00006397 [Anopheles sinensis]
MRLSWSFLRLCLATGLVVGLGCLLEQATGEDAEDVARSLGVSDVHDWDIRSLYRVRFQHITKRPPPGLRHAERKSNLATRWAALKERISDFFPSRHTNPRTVVTFDKIATDFVNVGIVKLAKALDPPKPLPKRTSRRPKKGKLSTPEPPNEVSVDSDPIDIPRSTEPTPSDVRPKRRVTLLVDLPDFEVEELEVTRIARQPEGSTKPSVSARTPTTVHPLLPEALMQLCTDGPCIGSTANVAQANSWLLLITASSLMLLLSVRRM